MMMPRDSHSKFFGIGSWMGGSLLPKIGIQSHPAGFDSPRRFAAYLNTLKWNCVTSTDPTLLQSPFRAGIRLDAYQAEAATEGVAASSGKPVHR